MGRGLFDSKAFAKQTGTLTGVEAITFYRFRSNPRTMSDAVVGGGTRLRVPRSTARDLQ